MKPLPLWLLAELTYRCPLQCPYRSNPLEFASGRFKHELTTEEWKKVLTELAEIGVLQIHFSGGLRSGSPALADRKSTRLNSSHSSPSRMPSSA